jgi:hypothetical protein
MKTKSTLILFVMLTVCIKTAAKVSYGCVLICSIVHCRQQFLHFYSLPRPEEGKSLCIRSKSRERELFLDVVRIEVPIELIYFI